MRAQLRSTIPRTPLLAGKLAAGFIRGAEGEGVGTSLKHFAVNNQETLRMSVSAEVDERALHELYLRPFEIAVKEGAPSTVMCSYNRINGVYASENRMLLTRILREQWGFDGLVMSDWGAVYRRPAGVAAGLDLEMPSSGGVTDREIVRAVRAGRLDEAALDALCARVLRLALARCAAAQKGVSRARAQCGGGAPHAGQAPRAGRARRAGERRAAEE